HLFRARRHLPGKKPRGDVAVESSYESDVRAGKGKPVQDLSDMSCFGFAALHELEPCRGVVKEAPDRDRGSRSHAAGFHVPYGTALRIDLHPFNRLMLAA